jgi:hypothetical protein
MEVKSHRDAKTQSNYFETLRLCDFMSLLKTILLEYCSIKNDSF